MWILWLRLDTIRHNMQTMEAKIRPLTSCGGVELLGIFAVLVGKNPKFGVWWKSEYEKSESRFPTENRICAAYTTTALQKLSYDEWSEIIEVPDSFPVVASSCIILEFAATYIDNVTFSSFNLALFALIMMRAPPVSPISCSSSGLAKAFTLTRSGIDSHTAIT